jgi:MSHA pilin protein MshC
MGRAGKGFTLVELVLVLVIVGVLSVFLLPRFNITGFERYASREEILGAAQYAQKLALASGCEVQLSVDSNSYALHYQSGGGPTTCGDGGFTLDVTSPSGGAYSGSTTGVLAGATVVFRGQGRPDGGATIQFDGNRDLVIEPETGYVHDG